jgi:deazaflavin-dependent oxidoreductase (nitroreductase family)
MDVPEDQSSGRGDGQIVDPATGQAIEMDAATGMPADIKAFNRAVIADLRANEGISQMGPLSGSPLAILITIGRKTGHPHEAPMAFAQHDDAVVVVASNNASEQAPDWFLNLEAGGDVVVEVLGDRWNAKAATVTGPARDDVVAAVTDRLPFIPDHDAKVEREIPIVVLERA